MHSLTFFSSIDLTELAPILTLFAGMLVGFYSITKFLMNQAETDRDKDRVERQELSKAIASMATSNEKIAIEMRDGNEQAKIRNGHLGEQNVQITELVLQAKEDTVNAIREVKEQHVAQQVVENERVINKE